MAEFEETFFDFQGFNTKEDEKKIILPFIYTHNLPHDNYVRSFISALNIWYKIPEDKVETIQHLIELYCTSVCLLDDVVDRSQIRRNHPSAHKVFGVPATLEAYFYSILILQRKLPQLHPEANKIFIEELTRWHYSAGLEVYYGENLVCPSEEQYGKIANSKFYALAALGFRLMELFSKVKLDYKKLLILLSDYFILQDDYLNLFDKNYAGYHGFASDITEGKFTRPLIHAINKKPNDNIITMILKQKTEDEELKKLVLKKLEETGSKEYMENKINNTIKLIKIELKRFKENPELEKNFALHLF